MSKRPISEGAEEYLNKTIDLYQHGFVYLVDYMGNDQSIVDAARRSLKPGEQKNLSTPVSLIRYLMRHKHTSPIEMVELKFHLKMPIFVARQWMRHRMASINELSGRYSILDREFYIPALEDISYQSTDNHQGRGDSATKGESLMVYNWIDMDARTAFEHYDKMMGMNIAKEIGRINLPVGTFTEFYWKIDLHNLFGFLNLRLDDHAQLEIREYAGIVAEIVKAGWPVAYKAFEDYIFDAITFSGPELELLALAFNDAIYYDTRNESSNWHDENHELSKRELIEFYNKLERIIK